MVGSVCLRQCQADGLRKIAKCAAVVLALRPGDDDGPVTPETLRERAATFGLVTWQDHVDAASALTTAMARAGKTKAGDLKPPTRPKVKAAIGHPTQS